MFDAKSVRPSGTSPGGSFFSLLKAAFLFVRKRGGKWEEKSPPLRSDTLRHATFHRFSQKGRGRESQAGDPPLAAGVFHEPALPCSPSPGRYLKQKHLRASMLLCGAIPDPTIFHSDGAPFSALFRPVQHVGAHRRFPSPTLEYISNLVFPHNQLIGKVSRKINT